MYNHRRFAGMLIQLLKILKFWTMTNRVIVLQYRMAAFSCPPLQHPLGKLHFSFLRKFRYWVTIWSSWRAEQTHQLVDYTPRCTGWPKETLYEFCCLPAKESQHLHTGRQHSVKEQHSWECKADCEVERTRPTGTLESCICLIICNHTLVSSPHPHLVSFKANYRFLKTFLSRIWLNFKSFLYCALWEGKLMVTSLHDFCSSNTFLWLAADLSASVWYFLLHFSMWALINL